MNDSGRCEYSKTCQLLVQLFDTDARTYQVQTKIKQFQPQETTVGPLILLKTANFRRICFATFRIF